MRVDSCRSAGQVRADGGNCVLGDKIWEATGKVMGSRVLPGDDYRYVKVETSIEHAGKLLGKDGGGMTRRYSVAYQAGPRGPLAALNGALVVGEYEQKSDGTFTDTAWLWK
ncbi:MAG: hypothetical protein EXR66_06320 [Dehalococcoidia bacterium]|nr:hypothetical protein [Dehalococcoidia bacterium]